MTLLLSVDSKSSNPIAIESIAFLRILILLPIISYIHLHTKFNSENIL